MGATTFFHEAWGKTMDQAFIEAKSTAAWEHGHGGYTGTLAEKHGYKKVELEPIPEKTAHESARAQAARLLDGGEFDDKWGPAGCIEWASGRFLFFGWAAT